ncbi:MAG TPA: FKBP-type peptidyl-prolyl cis-trans isomerase [Thermoanaerobaculia bacterium]|nr:FKBP-type peptidyl-prolyl cis-trans isomerase [Thermoanaerobaculia bacterium]
MKKFLVVSFSLVLFAAGGVGSVACAQEEGEEPAAEAATDPAQMKQQASYGFGFQIGSGMRQQDVDLDLDAMIAGLRAAIAGEDPRYSEEQMQQAMMALQQQVMQRAQERAAADAEENLATGRQFLEENAQREGVTVLPSGLQYEILQEGTGPQPGPGDRVQVHYRGTLADGTVFDSSYDRGQPATFALGSVIPGFSEGIQKMKEGGKWKLFIPPSIGYGERSSGPIPPNSVLVFEVELLDVLAGTEAPPQPAPAPQGDASPGGGGR